MTKIMKMNYRPVKDIKGISTSNGRRKKVMILFSHRRRSPEATYFYRYLEEHSSSYDFDVVAVEDDKPLDALFKEWGIPNILYFGYGRPERPDKYIEILKYYDIKVIAEIGDLECFLNNLDSWKGILKALIGQTPLGWANYRYIDGVPIEYIPWSINTDVCDKLPKKDIPVSMVCSMGSSWVFHKNRNTVLGLINGMDESKDFVLGQEYGGTYYDILLHSKIFIVDTSLRKAWTQKYIQGANAGCLLMGDKPYDPENVFEDGVSFVEADNDNVVELIEYYLKHPRITKRISNECRNRVREKFSRRKVSKMFIDVISKYMD